jgi:Leucine-rich repeat (LRR) protein
VGPSPPHPTTDLVSGLEVQSITIKKEIPVKYLTITLALLASMPLLGAGFSIRELLAAGKIPAFHQEGNLLALDLSYKEINSLDGLLEIPNIKKVQQLDLNGNQLTSK